MNKTILINVPYINVVYKQDRRWNAEKPSATLDP